VHGIEVARCVAPSRSVAMRDVPRHSRKGLRTEVRRGKRWPAQCQRGAAQEKGAPRREVVRRVLRVVAKCQPPVLQYGALFFYDMVVRRSRACLPPRFSNGSRSRKVCKLRSLPASVAKYRQANARAPCACAGATRSIVGRRQQNTLRDARGAQRVRLTAMAADMPR